MLRSRWSIQEDQPKGLSECADEREGACHTVYEEFDEGST